MKTPATADVPATAVAVLEHVRAQITKTWTKGDACNALSAVGGPRAGDAAAYFNRANGQAMWPFECDWPSHADMLAALDRALETARAAEAKAHVAAA